MSYRHDSGTTDDTATVPAGKFLRCYSCVGGESGGSITITEEGASAQTVIPVGADEPFGDVLPENGSDCPAGTTIAFSGMARWFVGYR